MVLLSMRNMSRLRVYYFLEDGNTSPIEVATAIQMLQPIFAMVLSHGISYN